MALPSPPIPSPAGPHAVVPVAPEPTGSRWPGWLLAAAAIAIACQCIAATLHEVARLHHPLPYWDEWDALWVVQRWLRGELDLHDLWAQHNEHRLVFPRLIFLLDALLGDNRSVLSTAMAVLFQFAHAVLLVVLLRGAGSPARSVGVVAAAAVATLLLQGSQIINLCWGFQVQFTMVWCVSTAALYCLVRHCRALPGRTAWGWLLATLAAATVAIGSMANGVLIWPVLLSLGWQLRAPRRTLAVLAVAGAAAIACYLVGYYTPPDRPPLLQSAGQPLKALRSLCAYLVSPLWPLIGDLATRSLVAVGANAGGALWLLLIAVPLLRSRRHWRRVAPARAALLHLLLLVLGTACVTALGRLHLPVEDVMTSRYATPPLIALAVLAGLWLARPGGDRALRWRAAVVVGACAALGWIGQRKPLDMVHVQLDDAACSLLSDIRDDEVLQRISGRPPDNVCGLAAFLRAHRMSVFRDGRHLLLGAPLRAHYPVDSSRQLANALDVAEPIASDPGAWRFTGWAYDKHSGAAPVELLAVDAEGRITGFGHCHVPRPDVVALSGGVTATDVGWRCWGRTAHPDDPPPLVYAVFGDGRAVPIGGQQVPRLTDDLDRLGAFANVQQSVAHGTFLVGKPGPGAPTAPFDGGVWGSWHDAVEVRGQLGALVAVTVDGGELIIPVLTGADTSGLSIRVRDAVLDRTLVLLANPPPSADRWRTLCVPIGKGLAGRTLTIVVDDDGPAEGQWLAVGQPRWSR